MTSELSVATTAQVDDLVAQLIADKVASRIAAKDATLWGPEAESEASIRLGWTDLHETSRPLLAEIEALLAELRSEGLDRIALAGMGGSSLAPEVITRTAGVELTVLDTTDPQAIGRILADGIDRTVLVVSSKSGSTLETDSQRRAFEAAVTEAGIDAATRIVVVTDPGSGLAELAEKSGYRRLFLADPDVGGRYSALTAFGLVPSGLAGVDIAGLLDEAAAVAGQLGSDSSDNPALVLGAAMGAAQSAGRDKLVLIDAGTSIVGFGDWAEQLIAESTGKTGTGILPVVVGSAPAGELAADELWVRLLGDDDAGAGAAGAAAVGVAGTLGAQLLLWEYATAIAGRIIGINPFDQPDVESAKAAARGLLDAQPEPAAPAFVDGGIEVRASTGLLDGVDTLEGAVAALLSHLGDRGYLAVMAYLDREGEDARLHDVRVPLARRAGRPVTFGWGPRFLHSTGQFHKGGPPIGVFLQVTGSAQGDVAIPGRPFSFGQLITAQAAGDANVLADHGRPVLRLHLTDRAAGIRRLLEVLR